ncbi:MAG: penicillin-binding transpeptidase domain-containing protein [Planctomycetota bacterium]
MFKTRIGIIAVVLGVFFSIALGRLFQLQVLRYEKYRALAERDNGPQKLTPAPRAAIVTSDNVVIAEDRPFFDISVRVDRLKLERVTYDEIKKSREAQLAPDERKARVEEFVRRLMDERFVAGLAATLKRDRDDVARGVFTALDNVARKWASLASVQSIVQGVNEDVWLQLKATHEDGYINGAILYGKDAAKIEALPEPPFPGLVCTLSTRRVYPRGTFACAVLGCVNDMSEPEETQLRQCGVLLESFDARAKAWTETRKKLDGTQVSKIADLIGDDPREIDNIGELYDHLVKLNPHERDLVARLGMADQLKWIQRPPRTKLNEAESLWLGVGMPMSASRNSLGNRTIGEMGVERFYNDLLRGKHTMKFSASDLKDFAVPASFQNESEPRSAKPLMLTISSAWQEAAEAALQSQECRGAIVVLDANTGAVLAMVSNPGFDPNVFTPPRTGARRQEQLAVLANNPDKPLINRAIDGEYPLGSIMKVMVMAAALERGQLTPEETFQCPGYLKEGGQTFHCDGNHAHGTVNVYKCLRCSCNVMSHLVGARVGVENLGPYAKLVLGKKTGIDLPFEKNGVYPDRAYRLRTTPEGKNVRPWTLGNDFQLAIGQGEMNSTVIQAAVMMAAIGNGGNVVTPRIRQDAPPVAPVSLGLSARTLAIVKQGLDECVNVGTPGERGTCYTAFHANGELAVRVSGKTSTAEHKKGAIPHAWFAGNFQADGTRIAFAVMLEEAGHGGGVAGPVAYKMLREMYGTKSNPKNVRAVAGN